MQADIKILPLKTINQLKTRIMMGSKEGCSKDYVLVLEADN